MSLRERVGEYVWANYECYEWKHASAILAADYPDELKDIIAVLSKFRLLRSQVAVGGKNKSKITSAIDSHFNALGWRETKFDTKFSLEERVFEVPQKKGKTKGKKKPTIVDKTEFDSPTHKVDCFKNGVGLEIEWNNKDPFFDRDLNNFRLLFELRALSVGVIVTRKSELQSLFNTLGRGKSYGNSTTHMSKLLPRLDGGAGGGCPVLVFGISQTLYEDDLGEPLPPPEFPDDSEDSDEDE